MDNETEERDFAPEGDSTYNLDDSPQTAPQKGGPTPKKGHQKLVFTDPAAFRYLEEDPSTIVLERRRRLTGYELYVVEQWACSRVHPTFVITTYTGLAENSVVVSVLSVPTNEEAWSPRLRVYLKAITKYHARKKETPLGTLMVTNLNGFPSALTVIAVPDGDLRKHREDFIVNEDLKRLGCSGRAGLSLSPPIGATQAKFNQLYHISDRIPIYNAVIELLKLCQVALMLFGKLAPEYADGLLCDVTEQAINDWWTDVGSDYFNVDPSDGILGPTTVAALLGTLIGARNRLNAYGAPISKDVFDIVSTKRGIAYFQKSQKMERTRRLDRQTLDQLHKVTAKATSKDSWTVPRAVKSTVAELSGKGGDHISGREKAGIAEVETLDMETFVQLGSGERFKWLWYGKPRKNNDGDVFSNLGGEAGMVFNDNQDTGYSHSFPGKRRDSVDDDTSLRHTLSDKLYLQSPGSQTSLDHGEKDLVLRRAVLKNMTGKVTDARSGLGRIRDAVGRRGHRAHNPKLSKDDIAISDGDSVKGRNSIEEPREAEPATDSQQNALTDPDSGEQSLAGSLQSSRRGSAIPDARAPLYYPPGHALRDFNVSTTSIDTPPEDINVDDPEGPNYMTKLTNASSIRPRLEGRQTAEDDPRNGSPSIRETRALRKMQGFEDKDLHISPLRRTRSLSQIAPKAPTKYWDRRWPRHLSFTAMVDVLAASTPPSPNPSDKPLTPKNNALFHEKSLSLDRLTMSTHLTSVRTHIQTWTEEKVSQVETYDTRLGKDNASLEIVYHQKFDEYTSLREATQDCYDDGKAGLGERVRELETLGAKLEYELQALEGKVEDVEDGVREFGRQVLALEVRVGELDGGVDGEGVGWVGWLFGRGWWGR